MSTPSAPSAIQVAVPYRDSEQRFAHLAGHPGSVWLDSGNAGQGSYDIISCDPEQTFCLHGAGRRGQNTTAAIDGRSTSQHDPFTLARQWQRPRHSDSELPFYGGTIGYLSYEYNQALEQLSPPPPAATDFPDAWLGYYSWALIQHPQRQRAWLVADSPAALRCGQRRLAAMDATIDATTGAQYTPFMLTSQWQASTSKSAFVDAVGRVQAYIRAGDCYQVNLARHFQARYSGSPWQAYCLVRRTLPSPYSAFLNTGGGCLLSHSPERFLQVHGEHITTSPIKGTRPRSAQPDSDRQLASELLHSAKDRAENVMIVDLLRNDLGRSCQLGSVRVQRLCELESFANVHHLVSTISGQLRPHTSALEALKLAFPGGSITGAPKIRAMDIINELEPVTRSAYCGSVFHYSNHGRLDSSITIRSLVADDSHIHCWGGGGIVADSLAEQEYQEGLSKIRLLLDTLATQPGTGTL